MTQKRRLHFTVRWLLALTTVVAAVTAFAANYPRVALLVAFVCCYVLIETSLLATVGANLGRMSVAMVMSLVMVGTFMLLAAAVIFFFRGDESWISVRNLAYGGTFCFMLAGLLAFLRFRNRPNNA
jgi:hypothetical protein